MTRSERATSGRPEMRSQAVSRVATALGSHCGSEMFTTMSLRARVMLLLRVQKPMLIASGKTTEKELGAVGVTCQSHVHLHKWLSSASINSGVATASPTTVTKASSEGEGGASSGTSMWKKAKSSMPCPYIMSSSDTGRSGQRIAGCPDSLHK
ncbi:uncharacterized protein [Triticum aestivum]|uniref:uncharacterized protein n=1 Tax=Triticum aestivum TaxID=4565 RepID=UPI001D0128B8|nr:uncharacterized protein LOC123179414 [Triticum aestivum]